MTLIPDLYGLDEVIKRVGKSRRWLQNFLRSHPVGRMAGRTRLFTAADIAKLIESLPAAEALQCRSRSFRRNQGAHRIGVCAALTSDAALTEARRLANEKSLPKSSQHGRPTSNVVAMPGPANGEVSGVRLKRNRR